MRLTLVISSLQCGGSERVLSVLANAWAAQGKAITLLTFDDGREAPFYELDSRIRHIPLALAADSSNFVKALGNNFKRIIALRKALQGSRPDAVVSFMSLTNIRVLIAAFGLSAPVIISERCTPNHESVRGLWKYLRRLVYRAATYLVVQHKAAANYFHWLPAGKVRIIPNPVLTLSQESQSTPVSLSANFHLVAVGRLEVEKGFDLLLRAFAQLRDKYPQWTLTILGEGSQRLELESLRDQLRLTKQVRLPGKVKNVACILQQSNLFVLPSRQEGFPNALCEAMACGLPVIATDCPTGPREIIRDKVDGLLVPNENLASLTQALSYLMESEDARRALAQQAPEVVTRYGLPQILQQWEELFATSRSTQQRWGE